MQDLPTWRHDMLLFLVLYMFYRQIGKHESFEGKTNRLKLQRKSLIMEQIAIVSTFSVLFNNQFNKNIQSWEVISFTLQWFVFAYLTVYIRKWKRLFYYATGSVHVAFATIASYSSWMIEVCLYFKERKESGWCKRMWPHYLDDAIK